MIKPTPAKALAIRKKYMQQIEDYARQEQVKYEADIAQAIGYSQGIGHPNKYLESRYPHLAELSEDTKSKEEKT